MLPCSTRGSTLERLVRRCWFTLMENKGPSGRIGVQGKTKALEVMKKKESSLWETKLIELEMVCGGACTLYLEYLRGKCG